MATDDVLVPTTEGRVKLASVWAVSIALVVSEELFWPDLMAYVRSLPLCDQLPWLQAFVVAAYLMSLLVAAVFLRIALRILAFNQAPPPSALVFFRTPIKRGTSARLQAYVAIAISIAALVVPAYFTIKVWPTISPIFVSAERCYAENA